MAVRGYVLIETDVGKAKQVSQDCAAFVYPDVRLTAIDTVTGPYDVIIQLESDNLDRLGNAVTEMKQNVRFIERTTFCFNVRLA